MKYAYNSQINQIGKEILQKLKEKFNTNLVALAFYGSRVRGDNFPDSDLDLLIILTYFDEVKISSAIFKICSELSMKYKIVINPYIISRDDFLYGCKNFFPFNLGVFLSFYPLFGEAFIEKCHVYISEAIKRGELKVYPRSGIFIHR